MTDKASPSFVPSAAAEKLLKEGRLDEAAATATAALSAFPDNPGLHDVLGAALIGMGAPDRAMAHYQAALRADPTHEAAGLGVTRARILCAMAQLAGTPGAPAGLAARGPYRDTSGYSYMVRRYLGHWLDDGVQVLLAGKNWGPELDADQRDQRFDKLERAVAAETALHFDLPSEVLPVPGLRNINMTMTECSRVPTEWVQRSRWVDKLILPTLSSRDAWIAAGMPADKIELCPLGCDPPERYAHVPPARLTAPSGRPAADFPVRVVSVISATVRKNLDGMLRAWAQATQGEKDAVLILKLGKDATTQDIAGYFNTVLARNGVRRDEIGEIIVIIDKLTDDEIIGLYKASTHYWSMSFGEGWDLPMIQAGACGLTLAAPAHSAYLSYLHDAVAHLIPATAELVPWETDAPTRWWRPDEAFAVDLMRSVVKGTAPAKASAQDHLLTNYDWRVGARRLLEISGYAR
jgi:tetratricopeptide (TPR) repeat protein